MLQARAGAHVGKPKARRARQRREGVVIMIVMLMIVMATGTAMFAIQSTQYEQRAAAAIGEANWARSVSECTAMAAIAAVEGPKSGAQDLGVEWKPGGSPRAKFSLKYAFPTPLQQVPGGPGDIARSAAFDTALSANNAVGGLLGVFLPDERRRNSTLPSFSDRDDQTGATPGLRFVRAHWLQESLPVVFDPSRGAPKRTRYVVTGFGEVHVANDPLDSDGVRELHELDAISRGYIDKVE